jgi:hypothetical protein
MNGCIGSRSKYRKKEGEAGLWEGGCASEKDERMMSERRDFWKGVCMDGWKDK